MAQAGFEARRFLLTTVVVCGAGAVVGGILAGWGCVISALSCRPPAAVALLGAGVGALAGYGWCRAMLARARAAVGAGLIAWGGWYGLLLGVAVTLIYLSFGAGAGPLTFVGAIVVRFLGPAAGLLAGLICGVVFWSVADRIAREAQADGEDPGGRIAGPIACRKPLGALAGLVTLAGGLVGCLFGTTVGVFIEADRPHVWGAAFGALGGLLVGAAWSALMGRAARIYLTGPRIGPDALVLRGLLWGLAAGLADALIVHAGMMLITLDRLSTGEIPHVLAVGGGAGLTTGFACGVATRLRCDRLRRQHLRVHGTPPDRRRDDAVPPKRRAAGGAPP